ncbi:RNA polymerase factor sigma-54 [Pseudoxanthomonas dokdonensis]|uniref:RNA polymerase sigma-54 factor n=1 Tax=Pseudoxanthomonas dokdonensis TaxID=344882 RepID=A0A0R0CRZ4_9GAMM|nr:RNA polymerase factor sigma-54 [Pseudoxanthomonas dokdonensis]KRG67971.1 RNA polymerase sigma54 factor [Pseudoxanthomonas dokdonensis]
MKARLQTSLGQQLVMTPQLRQAIRLLQMSTTELEAELSEAVETNPLLDWADESEAGGPSGENSPAGEAAGEPSPADDADPRDSDGPADDWMPEDSQWSGGSGGSFDDDEHGSAAERMAEVDNLHDHLLWQLHLSHLSERDRRIGATLIDAMEDDGYLRVPLSDIADSLRPEILADEDEVLVVLHQLQRFDPVGVAARSLSECLQLQLGVLSDDTPGKALALLIAGTALERLPRSGAAGLASELKQPLAEVETAIQLLRGLDPKPGAQIGELAHDNYVVPDCVIWRQRGVWRVALSRASTPRITIHRAYESMISRCGDSDAGYLRGHLQEARWLLKSLEARGETLLKVVQCLLREQAGFLEFGERALRPLTLREVATEVGLHESTVSRAVARKYVRTPRGTLPLRAFFASGVETQGGGGASSTAIQSMIKQLVEQENPRKPLSDAKLAELLKDAGIAVARRTIAKYREALNILSSHERVRLD